MLRRKAEGISHAVDEGEQSDGVYRFRDTSSKAGASGTISCLPNLVPTGRYGVGTESSDHRFVHCTMVAFAIFATPLMTDWEWQNKSTALPLTETGKSQNTVETFERLTATTPPCWLPVMLEPSRVAWDRQCRAPVAPDVGQPDPP